MARFCSLIRSCRKVAKKETNEIETNVCSFIPNRAIKALKFRWYFFERNECIFKIYDTKILGNQKYLMYD